MTDGSTGEKKGRGCKTMKIELTKDEVNFIQYFLEEYYNGDFVGGEYSELDKLADSISDKLLNAKD